MKQRPDIVPPVIVDEVDCAQHGHYVTMADDAALGLPGRARGVDHVRGEAAKNRGQGAFGRALRWRFSHAKHLNAL